MDQISCPACGKSFQIDASYFGRSFQCHCGQMVNVPDPNASAAPPPQAPPPPPMQPGYGGGPPPAYQGGYGGAPAPAGTPGIVIAGFVLSFFGWLAIVGLILCAVGMGEAKRRNAGTGLATAGIIISCIVILLSIIWIVAVASAVASYA